MSIEIRRVQRADGNIPSVRGERGRGVTTLVIDGKAVVRGGSSRILRQAGLAAEVSIRCASTHQPVDRDGLAWVGLDERVRDAVERALGVEERHGG